MTTRREFLAGVGAVTLAGVAGCLGGDSDEMTLPQPSLGAADAPVTVAVYSDFQCPHCRNYHRTVFPRVRSDLVDTGRVRYEHHDFPIPVHPTDSWIAALAARSVQSGSGDEAFWQFADLLYEEGGSLSDVVLRSLAEEVGADRDLVVRDVAERTFEPVVLRNRREGVERGVPGTPAVFVNDETVDPTYAAVAAAVERATA